jgi:hypothetical protein
MFFEVHVDSYRYLWLARRSIESKKKNSGRRKPRQPPRSPGIALGSTTSSAFSCSGPAGCALLLPRGPAQQESEGHAPTIWDRSARERRASLASQPRLAPLAACSLDHRQALWSGARILFSLFQFAQFQFTVLIAI